MQITNTVVLIHFTLIIFFFQIELEKIIGDAIQKRQYQQQVMIFIVGYEDVSEQRLKTLTQINDVSKIG